MDLFSLFQAYDATNNIFHLNCQSLNSAVSITRNDLIINKETDSHVKTLHK